MYLNLRYRTTTASFLPLLSVYDAVKSLGDTLRHFNINKIQGSVDLRVRECNPSVKQTFLD